MSRDNRQAEVPAAAPSVRQTLPLRALLIEDSEDDALLLLIELRRGGYDPAWERVDAPAELAVALERPWDIVFCDYVMPRFSGPAALSMIRGRFADLPVIIVSGEVGEEVAVAAMKAGANDFITKHNLARLVPAVERELQEAAGRQARKRAEVALRKTQELQSLLVEQSPVGILLTDAAGQVTMANPAALDILGSPSEEATKRFNVLTMPGLRRIGISARYEAAMSQRRMDRVEATYTSVWGKTSQISFQVAPLLDDDGSVVGTLTILQDVTERRRADEEKTALLEIARDVSGSLDLHEIIDLVQRRTAAVLPCERVATYYWDEDVGAFRDFARYGVPDDLQEDASRLQFKRGDPIVEFLLQAEQPLILNDIARQKYLPLPMLDRFGLTAVMATPITAKGRPLGALVALAATPGASFDQRQAQLFQGIAGEMALALGTAEAYRAQQEEAEIAAALARVGQELVSSLNPLELAERLCRVTAEVMRCDCSHTFIFRPDEGAYVTLAGFGDTPEQWEAASLLQMSPSVGAGLLRSLADEQVVQVPAGGPDAPFPASVIARYDITLSMFMALRRGGNIFGVHAAGYRGRTAPFTKKQARIARGIAQMASLALENARLVEEVEKASRLKSDFVATMSHELRTPLNAIIGYTDLMLDGAYGRLDEKSQDITARVNRSARELHELIDATLDMSRLEAGRVRLELQEVAASALMREIRADLETGGSKPDVRLVWEVPADLPVLRTDAVKVKVVVKNLVANAIKFTERGSVTVRAAARDGGVDVVVADTGIGIDPAAFPIIFEPFRQVDSSSTRRFGGVGLGLYIVRRLLDMLGGEVTVESEIGRGSTFRVRLPSSRG